MKAIFIGGHANKKVMEIPTALPNIELVVKDGGMRNPFGRYDETIRPVIETQIYQRVSVSEDESIAVYQFMGEVRRSDEE